jgi:hypothetical protein
VFSASHDGDIKIWDVEKGILLANLTGHKSMVFYIIDIFICILLRIFK